MPFKSKAQMGAMFAAAKGKSTLGIDKEAAESFIAHSKNEKTEDLPQHVKALKAAKKHKR